uniref:Uncharacterized protein n=1 Tax=Onchocerca volvulus TaxID=6282 RepID=A0A8R1TLU0_ONCVO
MLATSMTSVVAEKDSEEDDKIEKTIKNPFKISIKGMMKCGHRSAYAVLINSIEEVKFKEYGFTGKGFLRTSHYYLSDRTGKFNFDATRYATDHKLYLNITHYCISDHEKRNVYQNCFMQVKHEIKGDLRAIRFDLNEIDLEEFNYQSEDVKCVDWPYKYPKYYETKHNGDL